MTEREWRARYAKRMLEVAGVLEDEAAQLACNVVLGGGGYDLETDSPEDAADDEMRYWE